MRQPRPLPVYISQSSFNFVEFELQLIFQTLPLTCSKVIPISFVCCIPLSAGRPHEWVLARDSAESTEGSGRTLPRHLPLPALNKNAMSGDVAAFVLSWGKSQGNHRDNNLEPYYHCAAEPSQHPSREEHEPLFAEYTVSQVLCYSQKYF